MKAEKCQLKKKAHPTLRVTATKESMSMDSDDEISDEDWIAARKKEWEVSGQHPLVVAAHTANDPVKLRNLLEAHFTILCLK